MISFPTMITCGGAIRTPRDVGTLSTVGYPRGAQRVGDPAPADQGRQAHAGAARAHGSTPAGGTGHRILQRRGRRRPVRRRALTDNGDPPLPGRQGSEGPMTEGVIGQGPLRAGSPLRTPRAAAVAGIIFSVLLISAFVDRKSVV